MTPSPPLNEHAVLDELDVLALDCQASGANPDKGMLIETGWMRIRAADEEDPGLMARETRLVRLPPGKEIPPYISRITGVSSEDLASAHEPREVWEKLAGAARETAAAGSRPLCPTVIHFSRFEEPFLRDLHQRFAPDAPFPFDIVCTHEIIKRLLPGLPRRGLRAVAGYFGRATPKFLRCAHHLEASAVIWRNSVKLLKEDPGVHTWKELKRWLETAAASGRTGREYPMDRALRLGLPDGPGVYKMQRANSDLLYVGKAKSLKHRVNSYFQKRRQHAEHILEMLTQARNIQVTPTRTALEAALLESDEIKRHAPPYNIALRSDSRRLGFCSRDLRVFQEEPDALCRVGPLPSPGSLQPLGEIARLLKDGFTDAEDAPARAALGVPEAYAPDMDCFRDGFQLFRQRHEKALRAKTLPRALSRLGADLWRERLEAADEEKKQASGDGADKEPEESSQERVWTPEDAADALESVVRRGAWLIRRSRWLCMLSESSLAWETANPADRARRLLVFEAGAIHRAEDLPWDAEIPSPPGRGRKARDRRLRFDVMTYDRLRIATTELRRLLTEGREITLRLGPSAMLGKEALARALRWV
ncbi:MAG: GIY-YIG nuclease family protein [Desulfobacterales bacterium]|nr:GIY-YIG nuclease family protein [Desulfobacterales bacterium]